MEDGRTASNLTVLALATFLYGLLYAPQSLWEVLHRRFGIFAFLLWVGFLPTFFGLFVHRGIGVPRGASLWAVVAAPVLAHGAILAWHSMQPMPARIEQPTAFYTMIAAQVFFVHLGATIAGAEPRLRRGR